MEIAIVTIVFFALTLAGTWLARRSAYSWADNEKAMGPEGADGGAPSQGPARGSAPGATAQRPGAQVGVGRGPGQVARPQARSSQIVVTGFDTPKRD